MQLEVIPGGKDRLREEARDALLRGICLDEADQLERLLALDENLSRRAELKLISPSPDQALSEPKSLHP